MPDTHTYIAEVLAADINDAVAFEEARSDVYRHPQDQREARFNGLLGGTMLKGGEVTLADEVLEQFVSVDELATQASAHLQDVSDRILARVTPKASEKGVLGYRVEMDEDGTIKDIFRKTMLPQDSRVLSSAKNMSKRAPSGPRQNGSSFYSGSPVDPRSRH